MSRSGYDYGFCGSEWDLIRWRGAVASSIRGKRGQAFLKELLAALDAMPEKKLIAWELEKAGEVCALGAVGKCRGVDMSALDPEDYGRVADTFGIASPLAQEIVWENDEAGPHRETPEHRFSRVRAWVASRIIPDAAPVTPDTREG